MKKIITICLAAAAPSAAAVTLLWDAPTTRIDDTPITGELSYQVSKNGTTLDITPTTTYEVTVITGDEICVAAIESTEVSALISNTAACGTVPAQPNAPSRLRFEWVQTIEVSN